MLHVRSVVRGAMLLLAVPIAAQAQKSGARTAAVPASTPGSRATVAVFRDPDRTVFRDYFQRNGLVVTPLPRGVAKNIARGKPLPPGIARHAFPRSIIAIRPGAGRDVSFVMVGAHVVAIRNGIVVDMMTNLFP